MTKSPKSPKLILKTAFQTTEKTSSWSIAHWRPRKFPWDLADGPGLRDNSATTQWRQWWNWGSIYWHHGGFDAGDGCFLKKNPPKRVVAKGAKREEFGFLCLFQFVMLRGGKSEVSMILKFGQNPTRLMRLGYWWRCWMVRPCWPKTFWNLPKYGPNLTFVILLQYVSKGV